MEPILELAEGPARLRIAPTLGGRVVNLRLAGRDGSPRDILVPFPVDTRPDELLHWPKGGIYPLLPYGNRIRDARLRFHGREYALPPHPAAAPHTLHGHTHRVPWRMARNTASSARWELDHRAGESWPWSFLASFSAELSAKTVVFRLALRNSGEAPMPGGLGLHPYLVHDPTDVLTFRTEIDWPVTADFLADLPQRLHRTEPSGQPLPEGTVTLYRSGWDGIFSLRHPDEHVVRLQADPVFDHLVVHRPAEAHYVCVEPTTHAPDGFNLAEAGIPGSGRVILDAGQSLEGSIRISLHD